MVPDERGFAVAYMLFDPSNLSYGLMTGSDRTPVLIDEQN